MDYLMSLVFNYKDKTALSKQKEYGFLIRVYKEEP